MFLCVSYVLLHSLHSCYISLTPTSVWLLSDFHLTPVSDNRSEIMGQPANRTNECNTKVEAKSYPLPSSDYPLTFSGPNSEHLTLVLLRSWLLTGPDSLPLSWSDLEFKSEIYLVEWNQNLWAEEFGIADVIVEGMIRHLWWWGGNGSLHSPLGLSLWEIEV